METSRQDGLEHLGVPHELARTGRSDGELAKFLPSSSLPPFPLFRAELTLFGLGLDLVHGLAS